MWSFLFNYRIVSTGFTIIFGRLDLVPNNGYLDVTPAISLSILTVYATHTWFTGACAFNHVVTVGTNGTIIRISNRRIINNDADTFSAYWLALGY